MKRLLLAGWGAILTTLLVWLPLTHVSTWSGRAVASWLAALALLPLGAWAVALVRPAPWATLWLFPAAHLPVLIAEPELTGPLVYGGSSGLAAFAAVAFAGAAWFLTALRAEAPGRRPVTGSLRWLPLVTALVATAVLTAFLAPVLAGSEPPPIGAAQITVLVGLAVAAHVAGRSVVGDLGDLWLDGAETERWLAAVLAERRLSPGALWATLLTGGVLGALVLFLYGVGA